MLMIGENNGFGGTQNDIGSLDGFYNSGQYPLAINLSCFC